MSGYHDLRAALVTGVPSLGADQRWPCGENPDLWFSELPAEVEIAKQICQHCPIHRRCLADAIARREPWGVWGGELLVHGKVVPRKRGRGRPRKDAAAA